MLDCIIIGSGPAGIEAAINLKIRNVDFLIFGQKSLSSSISKAPKIHNYLGLPNIKGSDLRDHFINHLNDLDIVIKEENVINVYSMKDKFTVITNKGEYESKTVIIATGKTKSKEYNNEERFLGSGVSYCATCDGLFYKNKDVCVVGENEESINDVKYLLGICNNVYYISKNNIPGAINIDSEIVDLIGERNLEKIVLSNNEEINVSGLFIIRDSIKPSTLVPGLEMENGFINVDKSMKTNLKNLYACGDVTGAPFQYMKSAGEGQIAAFEVIYSINNLKK